MVVCKHTPGGNVRYLLRLTPIAIDIQFLPSADLQSCKLMWRLREIRCVVSGLWACLDLLASESGRRTTALSVWLRRTSFLLVDESTTEFALDSLRGRL